MKKTILIIFLLCTSFLNAQVKTLNNIDFVKKEFLNPDLQKSKEFFSHQSVSVGGGLVFFDKENIPADFSVSTTFHFANSFHFEIKVDNYTSKHLTSNIYSFLPQIGIYIYEKKWRIITGIGLGIHNSKNESYYLFSTNLKFEYFISNSYSVNTETIFWPPMQKLNLSYYLPY